MQTAAYEKRPAKEHCRRAGQQDQLYLDGNGNRLTVTDPPETRPSANTTGQENLLREINALGGVTEYTYDEVGLPLTVTDATGAYKP